jgi:hypothetical protein
MPSLTYEPEDFCFAPPVRARRALARERLPSYREPASRNPQAVHPKTFRRLYARALFRLLPIRAPRQEVLRTSSWLAPSLFHQQALRPPGGEDAQCVQPMSATQTNCVYPHLVCSRLALATFAAGTPRRVLGSARLTGGLDVSRRPRTLRRIVIPTHLSISSSESLDSFDGVFFFSSVGVFFPRR